MVAPSGIVTLTTDCGLADPYVAQLHAVLLSAYPPVRIVDVSHAVPPGNAEATLFLTESAWPAFALGTVHLVVVDPGVGTKRRLLAIDTGDAFLVGPDTGVLSSGLPNAMRRLSEVAPVPLPPGLMAVEISSTAVRAREVSATFHGRDIMAPVAARLAAGADLTQMGTQVRDVMTAPTLAAPIERGVGEGRIIHIDRFGNAITNFRQENAPARFVLSVRGARVAGPASSYQAGRGDGEAGAVAIGGSSGYLEVACPGGSAAERLGLRLGDPVALRPDDAR